MTAFVNTPNADSSHAPTISMLLPACRPKLAKVGSLIATADPIHAFCDCSLVAARPTAASISRSCKLFAGSAA